MTMAEARFQIEAQLVELATGSCVPLVEQIDAVLLESGDSVCFYVHLSDTVANGGLPLYSSADLAVPIAESDFDARLYEQALERVSAINGAQLIPFT
jgi:hypothetical protein